MSTLLDYESNKIVELMDQPAEERNAQWLKSSLQQAVLLELATIPPYLCGLWSIKDPDENTDVFNAIREIIFDEMSHLGLACNLLTTIGGAPQLADEKAVPKYPGPLPGGVRPELSVSLSGLTRQSLDMYCQIERPDDPVAELTTHPSIGAFYEAILDVFRRHPDLITGIRQVTRDMAHHGSGNNVVPLNSLREVETAINIIKEQGEGTSASPENPHPGSPGELAHFYTFREIFHGRKLIKVSEDPVKWDFQGPEIRLPQAFPVGTVPRGGWGAVSSMAPDPETKVLLDTFNRTYSTMLRFIEQAWQTDVPSTAKQLLNKAVLEMFRLQEPAQKLMRRELPDGSGKTYCPEFRYVDA